MKRHTHVKGRGPARVNPQQVVFELKHKVVIALNKLADRDTYQLGVEELEKMAECLTPDGLAPFLSCILDTDSEQKSAVRKECIRLIGTLVRYHEGLVGQHLGKMVASIVKRLKDPDSVVRDACVETAGVLASKLSNGMGEGEGDGVFVVIVRPLFEAMGEQNRQVQSGSALCLARVIDNTHEPPVSILQRMLNKTIKLLKNQHFMAKPAIIELNRSIIQAGGAPTQNVLSAAMASIQESLKSNDWATRKAACTALGEIASGGGSFLGSFKASCIRSLESCRFDKVKPVRDTVLQALQCWKSLPGSDTPEPSEAGSSIKENFFGGDYSDITSASESGRKDVTLKKVVACSTKSRVPLTVKKTCPSYVDNHQRSNEDDWHIEIAVPKTHNASLPEFHNEESEGSSITKSLERTSMDVTSTRDMGYEYVPMDEKQECSSGSNLVNDDIEAKFVTVSHNSGEGGLRKPVGRNQRFAAEEIDSKKQMYSERIGDRRSLDSTVTESSSHSPHGCCSQMANEVVCIRKQLLEIETKQSSLMDLLQGFTSSIMDSMSMLQTRVVSLEHVIDRLAQNFVHREEHSNSATSKLMKRSQTLHSPRLSTSTPRPSIDIRNRQPSLLSVKHSDIWEESTFCRSQANNSAETLSSSKVKLTRNPTGKDIRKFPGQGAHRISNSQTRPDTLFSSASSAKVRQNNLESKNNLWKQVKDFLCEGDLDSAYVEALCSGDEIVLVELLDGTGPVLECLSPKTASNVLSTLASYLLEQRFINTIIPWLQQIADLSSTHGPNYLGLSAKAKQAFLSCIQDAVNTEFSNPLERRSVTQLAVNLQHLWGKAASYVSVNAPDSQTIKRGYDVLVPADSK